VNQRERALREIVVRQLAGGRAHREIADALAQVPVKMRGAKLRGSPHTAWELLEHLRLAQLDILEWSFDPEFVSPSFPDGLWPATSAPPDSAAWDRSVREFLRDLRKAVRIARDPKHDLLGGVPRSRDTLLLNQLLLIASHNSYHIGQLLLLARTLEGRRKSARRAKP
jgi:hypothetical protein